MDAMGIDHSPLSRMTWQTQVVLDVMLRAPEEGVWAHRLNKEVPRSTIEILRRLERAGWLTSHREPNAAGGPRETWRRVFRFTAEGVVLARRAVELPVRWPEGVLRVPPRRGVGVLGENDSGATPGPKPAV